MPYGWVALPLALAAEDAKEEGVGEEKKEEINFNLVNSPSKFMLNVQKARRNSATEQTISASPSGKIKLKKSMSKRKAS